MTESPETKIAVLQTRLGALERRVEAGIEHQRDYMKAFITGLFLGFFVVLIMTIVVLTMARPDRKSSDMEVIDVRVESMEIAQLI